MYSVTIADLRRSFVTNITYRHLPFQFTQLDHFRSFYSILLFPILFLNLLKISLMHKDLFLFARFIQPQLRKCAKNREIRVYDLSLCLYILIRFISYLKVHQFQTVLFLLIITVHIFIKISLVIFSDYYQNQTGATRVLQTKYNTT